MAWVRREAASDEQAVTKKKNLTLRYLSPEDGLQLDVLVLYSNLKLGMLLHDFRTNGASYSLKFDFAGNSTTNVGENAPFTVPLEEWVHVGIMSLLITSGHVRDCERFRRPGSTLCKRESCGTGSEARTYV